MAAIAQVPSAHSLPCLQAWIEEMSAHLKRKGAMRMLHPRRSSASAPLLLATACSYCITCWRQPGQAIQLLLRFTADAVLTTVQSWTPTTL